MAIGGWKKRLTPPVLRVIATAATFVLGLIGFAMAYSSAPGTDPGLGGYAVRAFQLVFGKFPAELDGKAQPLPLLVARYALPVLGWWTSINVAWLAVRNPVRLRWIAARGGHAVVAGDATIAARLVAGERKAGRPAIVWSDAPKTEWVADAANLGAPHAGTDARGLDALGLHKARIVVIAGPDDPTNVDLGAKAIAAVAKRRPGGDPLPVITRIDDPDLRAPLQARFERSRRSAAARLRLVSAPDVLARHIFRTQPLDRLGRLDAPRRHLLLLGFSPVAERLLLRVLAGAHFRGGEQAVVTVMERGAEHAREVFNARRPGAAELARVRFREAPIDQPALLPAALDRLLEEDAPPTLVLVDPDRSAAAWAVALSVEEAFQRRGVMAPPIVARSPTDGLGELGSSLVPFGSWSAFADPELLLQERHDALARRIHDFYLQGRLSEGERLGARASLHEWEDLPEAFRDDNRMVADLFALKLRDVGARIVDEEGPPLDFDLLELEELARAEHDRWTAAKLLDGWRFGPTRDDAGKLHPDIVPYDALSERVKELDREQIRMITRLLARTGKRAVRDLRVLAAGGAPEAVEGVLADLARRHPDRTVVLVGRVDRDAPRAALIRAHAAGRPIQAAAAGNVDALLDKLPHDEAVRLRAAMAGADRWLTVSPGSADRLDALLEREAALAVKDGAVRDLRGETVPATAE